MMKNEDKEIENTGNIADHLSYSLARISSNLLKKPNITPKKKFKDLFRCVPPNDWLQNLDIHRIKEKPGAHPPHASHPHYGPWFSDDGEDGILSYLFEYINEISKYAVDIGSAHGWGGSQIRHLVHKYDWASTEFDGGQWPCMHPRVKREWLTPENICLLLERENTPKQFDLLSLDLDSMDFYILERVLNGGFQPSVAIIEFNPIFEHSESYVRKYDSNFVKDGTSNYGASLKAYEKLMNHYDYSLVHVCARLPKVESNNCIFMHNKFISNEFLISDISKLHPVAWVETWKKQNLKTEVKQIKECYLGDNFIKI